MVRIEPSGVTIHARPGESVMRAAQRQGLRWPTICNGAALCGTCHLYVNETEGELPLVGAKEARGLLNVPPPFDVAGARLACQFIPNGDCVVTRAGVERDAGFGSA